MTAPSLLDELEEVVRLSERATPGTWHQDTGGDITRDDGTTLFTREKPDGRSSISFANADYVEAAVNFIRTHHAEIADMAKRLEAAERDARVTKRSAETLCRIYFEIAAEAVGEDKVRAERDRRIHATQEGEG